MIAVFQWKAGKGWVGEVWNLNKTCLFLHFLQPTPCLFSLPSPSTHNHLFLLLARFLFSFSCHTHSERPLKVDLNSKHKRPIKKKKTRKSVQKIRFLFYLTPWFQNRIKWFSQFFLCKLSIIPLTISYKSMNLPIFSKTQRKFLPESTFFT